MTAEQKQTDESGTDSHLFRRRLARPVAVAAVLALVVGGGLTALGAGPAGLLAAPEEPETAVTGVSGNVTVKYDTASGVTEEFVTRPVDPELTGAGWAFVDRSALPPALTNASGDPDAGVVPVGEMALVGSVEAVTRPVGNATITVVVPSGVDVDPGRKSQFISEFISPYALGPDGADVTLVAVPDGLPHRGAMYGNGTGYVTESAFWDGTVGSVWMHEFVHGRQSFSLSGEMEWFREASAEYLSYRMLQEQYGNVTNDDLLERLAAEPTYPESVLASESTWAGGNVPYTRGVRLLYRIDAAIRAETDGERTLVDVFRQINERDERLTLAAFARTVGAYTGDEGGWIRSAVTEPRPIDGYLDIDERVFENGKRS